MPKTNIEIDDELLALVVRRYGHHTKEDAVHAALREVADRDVRAFAGEEDGDRAADAAVAARDEGDFAFRFAGAFPERRVVHRRGVEFGLYARFFLMLGREGRDGVVAGAGLHRAAAVRAPSARATAF